MSSEIIHDIIKQLKTDPSLREKFLDALGPDLYVRRDEFNELLEEIKQLRIESTKRFERIDKRFERIDKRFERIDKRFEQMIETMRQGFDSMKFYVDAQINELTGRYGHRMESALRRLGREVLVSKGYDASNMENVQVIDRKGKFFGVENYVTDVDILYHDGETWIIEVKTRASRETLLKLSLVKRLLEVDYGMRIDRVILICLSLPKGIEEEAERMGIEVWHALKEKPLFVPPKEPEEDEEDENW